MSLLLVDVVPQVKIESVAESAGFGYALDSMTPFPLRVRAGVKRIPEPQTGRDRRLHDYLEPDLKLIFVGINPGLISAAAGHYYANPRNCFWRLLYEAGLTPFELKPEEDHRILEFGYGLTDMIKRPSRGASDLRTREFAANRQRLLSIVKRHKPKAICFNSKTSFEGFFGKGVLRSFGPQIVALADRPVFVLPSTSPANAATPLLVKLSYFRSLKAWLETLD